MACGPTSTLTRCEPPQKSKGTNQRHTSSSFKVGVEPTQPQKTKEEKCTLCEESHAVASCKKFKTLNYEERKAHVMAKGLCFRCLRRGHMIKECRRFGKPLTLEGLPPREEKPEEQPVVESFSAKIEVKNASPSHLHSPIIKVILHHADSPNKQVETYAMLDGQSNSCFITNSLANSLNVPLTPVDLKLTTMLDKKIINSNSVRGLVVRGIKESKEIALPKTYTRETIPASETLIATPNTVKQWPHLKDIELPPCDGNTDVGLLIGFNCSEALLPKSIKAAGDDEPFAVRTNLGWGITGNMKSGQNDDEVHFSYRTHAKEVSPVQIQRMYEAEFSEGSEEKMSQEDFIFMKKVKEGIKTTEGGHFQLPLPLKDNHQSLPNNRAMAEKRLKCLKTKMEKDKKYKNDYITFMSNLIAREHCEKIPEEELKASEAWYIPHHGVYHPKKQKIRIVFDCSAEFQGASLNHSLLQGPDLMNSLAGILCRFRKEPIAFACDIEGMFHQVLVPPEHRDYLRFLWFKNGDTESGPIEEYRMRVHLFGAISSPACANYALKATADMYEDIVSTDAANFVRNDFYVDDGLKSVGTVEEAQRLITDSIELCKKGGFKLHKFVSNHRKVLKAIPPESRCSEVQMLNDPHDKLPTTRTLGIEWCIESDSFKFRIEMKDTPVTRRGILSTVSSIFDPTGLISPFLLTGRKILQDICRDGHSWDDELPEDIETRWRQWREELLTLANLSIQRCYKPEGFGEVQKAEIHHFADASLNGYGMCSYLRLIDSNEQVCSSLVTSKSRVTPSRPITIPRLELTAARLAAKVSRFLDKELHYKEIKHYFWIDSKVVLGYIRNETRRFHMYVANRVQYIRESTNVCDWNYIDSRSNPADLTSRGMTVSKLSDSEQWWHGPKFLTSSQPLPENKEDLLDKDDPELRKVTVHAVSTNAVHQHDLQERLKRISSWQKAKRVIALCQRYVLKLKEKFTERKNQTTECFTKNSERMSTQEVQKAENCIIRELQKQAYPEERKVLIDIGGYPKDCVEANQRNNAVKRKSTLFRLDPFVSDDGLMRVGGRIRRAEIPRNLAHPVILPKESHVTTLIIRHFHERSNHAGMNTTLSELRSSGYWVVQARSAVSSVLHQCVTCRKLFRKPQGQKMADLPKDRLEPTPPFTYVGVDFFGPFYVKEGRSEKKRWGALFTCLVSRAVHIEVAHTLSTDSFLNAYRRFVGRRGPVRHLRCDRGTNFVGAKHELDKAAAELDGKRIQEELLRDQCDWVEFKMNIPNASHMGGVWERMIKSVRRVLAAILDQHGQNLDDELLRTFLVEAELVVNSRPLTYPDMNSPDSEEPITPLQLLTLKAKVVYPPPGLFVKEDIYCRKRWRRVQYLADQFWIKWKKEYLPTLQERRKWTGPKDNLQAGDVVLLMDENIPRCQWSRGIVTYVFPSKDELTRKVTIKTMTSIFDRPVHKLILLFRPESPTEEP